MISEEDFEFINAFDSEKNEINKQQILDRYGKNAAKALTNLIGQIARDQTVRYLLTMVDDILTMNKENITIFHEHAVTLGQQAWTPFVTLLSRPDKFICNQAARNEFLVDNHIPNIEAFHETPHEWFFASHKQIYYRNVTF